MPPHHALGVDDDAAPSMTRPSFDIGLSGVGGSTTSDGTGMVPRRIVTVDEGRTIAWAETGSGPDLLAIHGSLTSLDDFWIGPVPALAQTFRVVAVDRPGHGASERRRLHDASPWRQAELIHAAVRTLGLHRPVVLGHSFGGAVALAYGLLYPDEVRGIVALAPICFPEPRLEHVLFGPRAVPGAGDALSSLLHRTSDPALLRLLWEAMFLPRVMPEGFRCNFPFAVAARPARLVANGEDAASLGPGLWRSAAAYPSYRVPVRILAGDGDLVVNPILHGWGAAQLIPGAVFRLLPGEGHMLHHFAVEPVLEAVRAVAEEGRGLSV